MNLYQKIISLFIFVFLGINISFSDYFTWNPVGNAGFTPVTAISQTINFLGNDIIVGSLFFDHGERVAMTSYDSNIYNVGFSEYDQASSSWINHISSNQTRFNGLSMTSDSGGNVYLLFSDISNNDKATLIRWDGSNWDTVGDAGFSSYAITMPHVDILSNGHIASSFIENISPKIGIIYEYDNSSWSRIGGVGGNKDASQYSLTTATNSSGELFIAYVEDDNDNININKIEFDDERGSFYVNNSYLLDIASVSTNYSYNLKMGFGPDNNPVILYTNSGDNLVLTKFNGSSWQQLGGDIASNTNYLFNYDIETDQLGSIYVTYNDHNNGDIAIIKKWNGNNWESLANITPGSFIFHSLATDTNNNLYIAYQDGTNDNKSTLKKFKEIVTCFSALYYDDYMNSSCIGVPDGGIKNSDGNIVSPENIVEKTPYKFQISIKNLSTTTGQTLTKVRTKLGEFNVNTILNSKDTYALPELNGKVFKKNSFLEILNNL